MPAVVCPCASFHAKEGSAALGLLSPLLSGKTSSARCRGRVLVFGRFCRRQRRYPLFCRLVLGSEGGEGRGAAVAKEERGGCYGLLGVADWRRWVS